MGINPFNRTEEDSPFSNIFPNTKEPLEVSFDSNSSTRIRYLLANPIAALVGDPFLKAFSVGGPLRSSIKSSEKSDKPVT